MLIVQGLILNILLVYVTLLVYTKYESEKLNDEICVTAYLQCIVPPSTLTELARRVFSEVLTPIWRDQIQRLSPLSY